MEFHSFDHTIELLSLWHIDLMCHTPKLYREVCNENARKKNTIIEVELAVLKLAY